MNKLSALQRVNTGFIAFTIAFTQIFYGVPVAVADTAHAFSDPGSIESVDPAEPENSEETVYDLVTLVVDSDLANSPNLPGLKLDPEFSGEFNENLLNELTLDGRIQRYAEDIIESNSATDAKILFFDKDEDSIVDLVSALENLYRNGEGSKNNKLSTVVLFGDIPLPVVNKEGNSYVSIFPFVDFENRAYNFNPESKAFEYNDNVVFPKPEIGHGIMYADASDVNSLNRLAAYLDKNHLYYEGDSAFAEFDRKIFFADLVHEEEQINKDVYKRYLDFLDAQEDIAYMRYNKFWANELINKSVADIPFSSDENGNTDKPDFVETVESGNALAQMPDIYSKMVIDQSLMPYYKVFGRFISRVNDFTDFTGRYSPTADEDGADVHSVPMMIAMKDEYTKTYLRLVNDALEKKTNEIVSRMEKKLPRVEYTDLSGYFIPRENNIPTNVAGADPFVNTSAGLDKLRYQFHYVKEKNGAPGEEKKMYVNGIDYDLIDNAKMCYPYLGSTKSEYFNENDDFVSDVYSILTRSIRSDNFMTFQPLVTSGVNTRLLSNNSLGGQASELTQATNGAYSGIEVDGVKTTGAIIESSTDSGMPAFLYSHIWDKTKQYVNPFEMSPFDASSRLQEGDVIIAVNGKRISYAYSFDQAIQESYGDVESFVKTVLDENYDALEEFPHRVLLEPVPEVLEGEDIAEVFNEETPKLNESGKNSVIALMSIDYYRGNTLMSDTLTFTVSVRDKDAKTTYASNENSTAGKRMLVVLSDKSLPDASFRGFGSQSDGALMMLYENDETGFHEKAYDNSAGCNAKSTAKNSDRCLGMVATMPVFDPAGSIAPMKMQIPGGDSILNFPQKVKQRLGDNGYENSPREQDYETNVPSYPFPIGEGYEKRVGSDSYYQFEDVDEVYYNACFAGFPATPDGLANDSNPYTFVLDRSSDDGVPTLASSVDIYGKLIKSFGNNLIDKNIHNDDDYVHRSNESNKNEDNNGYVSDRNAFDVSQDIWLGYDDLTAADIAVHLDGDELVTLDAFAKRYGILDGKDNDGDGIVDYEWADLNDDGIYETKLPDVEEANQVYGIPSWNLNEIARKMLSTDSTYVIPYGLEDEYFPYDDFDDDIVLEVNASPWASAISSMVLHNEPTAHTIYEQIKSGTAFSLPIDNPRYVAFQTIAGDLSERPESDLSDWDVPALAEIIEMTVVDEPYYPPGQTARIDYFNIFEEVVNSEAALKAKLKAELAEKIAVLPGAYQAVTGANENTSLESIANSLYSELLAVVSNTLDDPIDSFDLENASLEKVIDALEWNTMSIDDKHEYVLTHFLNDGADYNAFVGGDGQSDQSMFPAPAGFNLTYGYEAAYLVFDGDGNSFDMKFNKDIPDEDDPAFDPLSQEVAVSDDDDEGVFTGGDEGGNNADDAVWIWEWPQEELIPFIEQFESLPKLEGACGFLPDTDIEDDGEELPPERKLDRLDMEVSKDVVTSNASDRMFVTVEGKDSNNTLVGYEYSQELVNLEINQDEENPVLIFEDLDARTLINGVASFKLRSTKANGLATLKATSTSGFETEEIQIISTGATIAMFSSKYVEIEGMQELLALQESLEELSSSDSSDGEIDSDSAVSDGNDSISEESENENGEDGSAVDEDLLESVIEASEDDTDKDEDEDNSSDSNNTEDGSNNSDGNTDGSSSGEPTDSFSDSSEDGTNEGDSGESDSNSSADGDDGASEGGDITILESSEVEINELVSTPVEDGEGAERDDEDIDAAMDAVENDGSTDQEIKENENSYDGGEWEEYFLLEEYYKYFIDSKLEAKESRYLAALPSDVNMSGRLLSYINDVNPFIDALENDESKYFINSSENLIANGQDVMQLQAVVYDATGKLQSETNKNLRFFIKDIDTNLPVEEIADFVVFENGDFIEKSGSELATTDGGVATIYLRAGTRTSLSGISGKFEVQAEVLDAVGNGDKSFPIASQTVNLEAGEVTSIEVQTTSDTLLANGQSRTEITFILKDEYGNIAENAFNKVAVFSTGVSVLDAPDVNSKIIGNQVSSSLGLAKVSLTASEDVGETQIIALMLTPELEKEFLTLGDDWKEIDFSKYVGRSITIDSVEEMNLSLTVLDSGFAETEEITANGSDFIRLAVELQSNGSKVSGYNGPVEFNVLSQNLGGFEEEPPENLVSGALSAANLKFISSTLTGEAEILVDIPGYVSDSVKFDLVAGPAKSIEISADSDKIYTNSANNVVVTARILDEFGNLVKVEDGDIREVEFSTTSASEGMISFSPSNPVVVDGEAHTTVNAGEDSGFANIIASSEGIEDGTIEMDVVKHLTSSNVQDFAPRAKYLSLLGGAFADVSKEDNLAYTLLHSGQVQAVTSTTAKADAHKRLLKLDGFGVVTEMSDSVENIVVPATNSFPYQRVVVSDRLEDAEIADIFLVPKADTELELLEDADGEEREQGELIEIPEAEGIYVQRLSMGDELIEFRKEDGEVFIDREGLNKIKIDKYGRVFISDPEYSLAVPNEEDPFTVENFSFMVKKRKVALGLITFKQNFNDAVSMLDYDSAQSNFAPGLYLKMKSGSKKFAYEAALTGYSTGNPNGAYIVDTENEIDAGQAPGFPFTSLENVRESFGVGFEGNNKHMLLFAAGNNVGEANKIYASEVGVIFGDPMIKVEVDDDLVSGITNHSKDVGKAIFSGNQSIQEMIEFDIDSDGADDLLLVYEDGHVRLLKNTRSNKRFEDHGYVLYVSNGIESVSKIDINNDAYDDLAVGTKEPCHEGEQCVSVFTNMDGHFVRKTENLELNDRKVYEMKAADMDGNGCEDLVTADSSGDISIFYNELENDECIGLKNDYVYRRSFGISVNPEINQISTVYVHYDGINIPLDPETGEEEDVFTFVLETTEAPTGNADKEAYAESAAELNDVLLNNEDIAESNVPEQQTYSKEFSFLQIERDARIGVNSARQTIDLNGGSVEIGDYVEYIISITNNSVSDIDDLMISDAITEGMGLAEETLQCASLDCGGIYWEDTGMSLRTKVIRGIDVPAGETKIVKYQVQIQSLPKVNFDIGNDFLSDYDNTSLLDNNDGLPDVLVRPEVNPGNLLTYIYSEGRHSNGNVNYEVVEVPAGATDVGSLLDETFAELGLPEPTDMVAYYNQLGAWDPDSNTDPPEPPEGMIDQVKGVGDQQNQDTDYNGCPDSWGGAMENFNSAAEGVANQIEGALAALRCSGGGCLPIPYNIAFLAPRSAIPGTAVLAIHSYPPYVFPNSSYSDSFFRFYLSPTLTMGLGTSLCFGPGYGHQSPCMNFAIPLADMVGACDAIQSAVDGAISSAKEAIVDATSGNSAIISDGAPPAGTDGGTDVGGGFGDSSSPIAANFKANIKIPGFPGVITNWIDKQVDEVMNKLLTLPTIYMILPDFSSLVKIREDNPSQSEKEQDIFGLNDFLSKVSSVPLIQLEMKPVTIKVPSISKNEILKYKYQGQLWMKHMENEIEKLKVWECDNGNPDKKDICDAITVDLDELISSVQAALSLVDELQSLPQKILDYRHLEAKYATQIICYMDAIMNFTGGWIKRQQSRVEAWEKAVQDVIRAFKSWKLILDLALEYQTSCDQCKSDRFSQLGLLLQLFVAIPEPPIIPLPKWPDVVIDLSKITTGVKIEWPDVDFQPQPITLPDLPFIVLPDILPEIAIEIPGFDVPQLPNLAFPDLPDLPPLPLPELPDLPRPPKIPELPQPVIDLLINLKPIFKILCLLKNGLIPVSESQVATEIETLTQPTVQSLIPIIKHLGIQLPSIEYDFVKEVRITAEINLDIDVSFIYGTVKYGSELWNEGVKEAVNKINQITQINYGKIISNAIQKAIDELEKAAAEALQEGADEVLEATGADRTGVEVEVEADQEAAIYDSAVIAEQYKELQNDPVVKELTSNIEELNNVLTEYVSGLEQEDYPETWYLTAEPNEIPNTHPLLNRSLAEVERDIALEDLPDTAMLNQMADLRDSMIAYTKGLQESNAVLGEIEDYDSFTKVLVDQSEELRQFADRISSLDTETLGGSGETISFGLFDKGVEKMIQDAAQTNIDVMKRGGFLASNMDYDPTDTVSGDHAAAQAPPVGFYIANSDGENENVLNYTSELGRKTHVLFNDVDNDADSDLIYSVGGDVYWKENHQFDLGEVGDAADELPKGELLTGLFSQNEVSDFVIENPNTVQDVIAPINSNNKVDISWSASANAAYYEMFILEKYDDDVDDAIFKYVVAPKPDPEEEEENDDDSGVLTNALDAIGLGSDDEDFDFEDEFTLELRNLEDPSVSIELENGNYYVRVVAVDDDGERTMPSDPSFLAPQSCADDESPMPVVQNQAMKVSIFKDIVVDASNSFDADGEILEYWLEIHDYETEETDPITGEALRTSDGISGTTMWNDADSSVDSGSCTEGLVKDGNPNNDRSGSQFRVGPFLHEGDIGVHKMTLHVVDEACNHAQQELTLEVYAPEINLDGAFSTTTVATGKTDPREAELPFKLMRNRFIYRVVEGELKLVPRIEKLRSDETDEVGEFEIADFNLEDMILVENADGEIVAEIDPETGNIGAFMPGYSTVVQEAEFPDDPTRVDIINSFGEVMGSVVMVANTNINVSILEEYSFSESDIGILRGVNVSDLDISDELVLRQIPDNDPSHPGGALLYHRAELTALAVIETSGNIIFLDDGLSLTQRYNDHEVHPLILTIIFENREIADVYIAASDRETTIVGPNELPAANLRTPSAGTLYGPANSGSAFTDIDANNDLIGLVDELHRKGILDGERKEDGSLYAGITENVRRSEFTMITQKMLCIVPREEAYQAFAAGEGYSDLEFGDKKLEVFAYIKEGTIRGLVEGYKGEPDPETGLLPFKPDASVTRAEAAKVIIEALGMLEVLDLSSFEETTNGPWYDSTVELAQDLSPYMIGIFQAENYILTAEEALDPNKVLTLEELIVMVDRVLQFYNCHEVDADGDGMADFCEERYGIDDPLADEDADGLRNEDECFYGLDPTDQDTDKGGVLDGEEVYLGTNGLNPLDDPLDDDNDGLTNAAEILVHGTDPLNPDTDGGGVNDGTEVSNLTNPLDVPEDDGFDGDYYNGNEGIYLIPAECNTCPCISTFLHEADVVPGDRFFPAIMVEYLDYYSADESLNKEKVHIFSQGDEVEIESITK